MLENVQKLLNIEELTNTVLTRIKASAFCDIASVKSSDNDQINHSDIDLIRDIETIRSFLKSNEFKRAYYLYNNLLFHLLPIEKDKQIKVNHQKIKMPLDQHLDVSLQDVLNAYNSLQTKQVKCRNNVKLVRFRKNELPLGVTIKMRDGSPYVERVVDGGLASKTQLLNNNDRILEINNTSIEGKSFDQILELMNDRQANSLSLLIEPSCSGNKEKIKPSFWRSNVNYIPELDKEMPCSDLGIRLQQGQIMELVSDENDPYWQVRILGTNRILASLVPSLNLQLSRWGNDCFEPYEKVIRYVPSDNQRRMIAVVSSIKLNLSSITTCNANNDNFKNRLQVPIYHYCLSAKTKRPTKYTLPKHVFEADILAGRFADVEWKGRKPLRGVTYECLKDIIKQRQIPIMQVDPQSLHLLRKSDLHPFVIFVSDSSSTSQKRLTSLSCFNRSSSSMFNANQSGSLLAMYGYFFDQVIDNISKIPLMVNRIQNSEDWVCAC